MKPSPISFKLEGVFQLYDDIEIGFIAPQTVTAYLKKHQPPIQPKYSYQQHAFNLAFYLITKS
ncbi:MAG: DUF3010 family protein [Chitinophagales bacterium]|nr:DUF3010 family protein [Chitinophagales bacterium]